MLLNLGATADLKDGLGRTALELCDVAGAEEAKAVLVSYTSTTLRG